MTISITTNLAIEDHEVELTAVRAQGAGGQNVNKVASAVHLRFNIQESSLPVPIRTRLLNIRDHRINSKGEIIIKAQQFRTQEKNREDAIQRLILLIRAAAHVPKQRRPTRPSRSAKSTRTDKKTRRGKVKVMRKKVDIPH